MVMDPVWTPDVSLGAWLSPRLAGWSEGSGTPVTSVVPGGYEAYARVLHPVGRDGSEDQTTWAAVCEATGRTPHPLMQWEAISGTRHTKRTTTMDWQGEEPEPGNLQPRALAAVLEVLQGWTGPDQDCVMALWEGFGWVDGQGATLLGDPAPLPAGVTRDALDGPRLELPLREYLLLTGPLHSAAHLGQRTPQGVSEKWPEEWLWRQSPSLLWPQDHAWCLSSEIDFDSTLIGGPTALVKALVSSAALEAHPVPPDGDLTVNGDHVNELLGRRRY